MNLNELLTSAQTTLNDDLALSEKLERSGKGRVYVGPDFPRDAPPRFLSLAVLSHVQDIDTIELEFTTLGVTAAVLATFDSDDDLLALNDITQRVNTLLHNQTSAITLTNDLISYISREGSLPPDTDRIGSEEFLVTQERFELLTITKG